MKLFKICFLLTTLFIFSACSTQKRLYTKGYYTSNKLSVKKITVNTQPNFILTKDINKQEVLQEVCDTIFFKNNIRVIATILRATRTRVLYKSCDTPNAPVINARKSTISHIKYANGKKEIPKKDTPKENDFFNEETFHVKNKVEALVTNPDAQLLAADGFLSSLFSYPQGIGIGMYAITHAFQHSYATTGGILGSTISFTWFLIPILTAVVGLTLCVIALYKAQKQPRSAERNKTKGLAIMGIIFSLILIIAMIALYFAPL